MIFFHVNMISYLVFAWFTSYSENTDRNDPYLKTYQGNFSHILPTLFTWFLATSRTCCLFVCTEILVTWIWSRINSLSWVQASRGVQAFICNVAAASIFTSGQIVFPIAQKLVLFIGLLMFTAGPPLHLNLSLFVLRILYPSNCLSSLDLSPFPSVLCTPSSHAILFSRLAFSPSSSSFIFVSKSTRQAWNT